MKRAQASPPTHVSHVHAGRVLSLHLLHSQLHLRGPPRAVGSFSSRLQAQGVRRTNTQSPFTLICVSSPTLRSISNEDESSPER
jgi:hypothetical protein